MKLQTFIKKSKSVVQCPWEYIVTVAD
jgi:hypothetical protein